LTSAWIIEIWRLIGLLVLALLAGLASGHTGLALFLGVATYLLWHLYNLYRLERWLRDAKRFGPPRADGIWGEVFHHYYRLQKRNRARKRRLASLIREFRESTTAMPDGAVVLGPAFEILWFNTAAARLLSLRVPNDVGQRVANLVRHPAFVQYIVLGDFREPVEVPSPKEPGRMLSLHLVPYGSAQHLLLIRDVTKLHRLESMRRDFVANASHELRSPLTVISGYLDTLLDDENIRTEIGPPLGEMRTQAERMRDIIDDLLELSRLESESGDAPMIPVDATRLLERVRDDARPLRKAGQVLELELASGGSLLGAEKELYSAFFNLVANALAYTPDHGKVTIAFSVDADGARVSVTDNGVGIPAEDIPRITERFYRVDKGRARKDGGTGLGLAIVRHALNRHDARLEIESVVGQGSTFTCLFPPQRVTGP
jgi:two-component system, OmpR family, phosphate regulon sensor histidine kinase PhoR